MFAICWSFIRELRCYAPIDLDRILIEGDKLHKSLNQLNFLSVDDLPRQINMFQYIADLEMKEENLYDSENFG